MATTTSTKNNNKTTMNKKTKKQKQQQQPHHHHLLPSSTTASRGWVSVLLLTTILIHVGLLSMRYMGTVQTHVFQSVAVYNNNEATKSSSRATNSSGGLLGVSSASSTTANDASKIMNDDQFYDTAEDKKATEEDDQFFVEPRHRDHDDHEGTEGDGEGESSDGSTVTSTTTTTTTRSNIRRPQHTNNDVAPLLLPHWMVITECSIYNLDCMTRTNREHRYSKYPLRNSKLVEVYHKGSTTTSGSGQDDQQKWPNMTMLSPQFDSETNITSVIPNEWKTNRLSKPPTSYHPAAAADTSVDTDAQQQEQKSLDELNYLYPPKVSKQEFETCWTRTQTQSTTEQLDFLFQNKIIEVEPTTNMLAWTISDWNYVYDMLHDIIQMFDEVVQIGGKHFLLVAIDDKTTKLACEHGYPVISWRPESTKTSTVESVGKQINQQGKDETALRDSVANSKVVLSYELVKRGIDFFFAEMDVWWISSPVPSLLKLQSNTDDDQYQMIFSGHQNNPWAPNIGIYASKANAKTLSYFELCIQLLSEKPDTHDQLVMAEVRNLYMHVYQGRPYKFGFGDKWQPGGVPEHPTSEDINKTMAFDAYMWSPHEIVGDERPVPTHETLAIHTLNGRPLQLPHGKKMVSREIGAYYGFVTSPSTTTYHKQQPTADNDALLAGYYQRRGAPYRRYLLLDSHIRTSLYSMVLPDRYHGHNQLQMVIAILMTLAIRTNRILILPQMVNADMDAGLYMLWNIMDYSQVEYFDPSGYEGMRVDIRETNFMSNPKSWRIATTSDDDEYWPFETVATTSVMKGEEGMPKWTVWAEMTNKHEVTSRKSWGFDAAGQGSSTKDGFFDVIFGALTATPEIDNSELLLVNLESIMGDGFIGSMENHLRVSNLSPIEKEIQDVYKRLSWCWDRGLQKTAGKSSASDSCYGNGAGAFQPLSPEQQPQGRR